MLWGPSLAVLRFLFPQGVSVRQLFLIHPNQKLQNSRISSLFDVRDPLVDIVRNHKHVATVDPPSQESHVGLGDLSRALGSSAENNQKVRLEMGTDPRFRLTLHQQSFDSPLQPE